MTDYLNRLHAWLDEMPRWPTNYGRGYREEVLEHLVALRKWAASEPEHESD